MDHQPQAILMPLDVSSRVGFFDRVAGTVARVTSRAPFFAFCVLLVGLWLVQGLVEIVGRGWSSFTSSTYQLEINTTTTIITFLLVALLQNSQSRSDKAIQHKLNAIADSLADHMENPRDEKRANKDAAELRKAVGLEYIESSDDE